MVSLVRNLNALWIVIYSAIITMAFGVQIFEGEQPCPLCYLQRIGMIMVSIAALFNLYYGVKLYHYGLSLLAIMVGISVAIRQILLHICPEFPTYDVNMFGLSLYAWSFLTFVASMLVLSILLLLYRQDESRPDRLNWFQHLAAWWLLLVAAGNVVSVLLECGLGACVG